MSRLEVPLQHRTLRATGDNVLWAELVLSLFLGDPDVPLVGASNLLGLTGVITHLRLTFEGTTSLVAPNGVLVVEKL